MSAEEHAQNGPAKAVEEPPPFPLTERDKWLLSLSDDEFAPHTWHGLKYIIGETPFYIQATLIESETTIVGPGVRSLERSNAPC